MSAEAPAVLEVRNLRVDLRQASRGVAIVRGIDLTVHRGEVLGILGESGSGKTVTGSAILRLTPASMRVSADGIIFEGKRIDTLDDDAFRALRGKRLAMIFQNPTAFFNPAKSVGWHFRWMLRRCNYAKPWKERAAALLAQVGIGDAAVLGSYPHQLSGGMLQRALIALVLSGEPAVIVADEPTTNLDNIVERQVIGLFDKLRRTTTTAFIFITHDIGIASALCDRIAVMYSGEIVEEGPAAAILADPKHPYTQGLFATATALERRDEVLSEIPGELPSLLSPPPGCLFQPRCVHATAQCASARPAVTALDTLHGRRSVRCVLYQ
jgi:peptide/nickel transport system ATP-binding protein